MPPSSESMLLCMRNDVTIVDDVTIVVKCEKSTTMSSSCVKKNFHVSTFHDGLKVWTDLCHHWVFPGNYLKYAFSIYKAKHDNQIRESPWWSWCYLFCINTHGWLFINDVTTIGVSYWWRREFPNYAWLHRGRIISFWCNNTRYNNNGFDHVGSSDMTYVISSIKFYISTTYRCRC